MYAIIHSQTKEFVFGTDYRTFYDSKGLGCYKQKTRPNQALTFHSRELAEIEFHERKCSPEYEIVKVEIKIIE